MTIPKLLSLSPGFGSRQPKRSIPVPINRQLAALHVGAGTAERSPQGGSFSWAPLSARSALKPPGSAMGIGFGEKERTKHVRISVSRELKRPLSGRYVAPARRGLNDEERGPGGRRASLNDSNHRRVLAELLEESKAKETPTPVEFPESTVIESGKLPSWDERRRIRLARGTAIATVRTVITSPPAPKSAAVSPALTRNVVAIVREDREEKANDASGLDSVNMPAPLAAISIASETHVPRTDSKSCRSLLFFVAKRSLMNLIAPYLPEVILCKFYHTPGLKCTASPCRFVHEISRTPLASLVGGNLQSKTTADDGEQVSDCESSTPSKVEIVEVFRMSGGGRGAGSEWAKAKFRSK